MWTSDKMFGDPALQYCVSVSVIKLSSNACCMKPVLFVDSQLSCVDNLQQKCWSLK